MSALPDASVDAVVTDPPYGLAFMNKHWDYDVPGVKLWREVFRVLKPGGHLLSFGGTRTYHRMAVAIEDAGFEIRDQVAWLYGSGFPKSQDVSKAIDKQAGAKRKTIEYEDRRGAFDGVTRRVMSHDASNGYGSISNNKGLVAVTHAATEAAKRWDGWGTALKPAIEPICLAR